MSRTLRSRLASRRMALANSSPEATNGELLHAMLLEGDSEDDVLCYNSLCELEVRVFKSEPIEWAGDR